MTPEQRAKLTIVGFDLAREGCDESAVIAWTDGRAVFFEGDQLAVVLALIAELAAAQAEIARLTVALATAREGGMREVAMCFDAIAHATPAQSPKHMAANYRDRFLDIIAKGAAT